MRRETKKFLYDIQRACGLILDFTKGKDFAEYTDDIFLRSAVERQFEIIGEAINQLARIDPETASRVNDYRQIVDFRNTLIHGYGQVDNQAVWIIVTTQLPALIENVRQLLQENGDA
ncbi:MAG: DUF86 domain-containing protein [Chloroflexi bacterium]|nr:DUF86 domain-containing protein [Chloroflexota bacterium]MCH8310160.1 DUF86 domain-containing protein [Chloroflexota bacterium]